MSTDPVLDLCVQFVAADPPSDNYPDQGPLPNAPSGGIANDSAVDVPRGNLQLVETGPEGPPIVRLALLRSAFWEPGRTLRVYFKDGSAAIQDEIMHYAKEWEALCNIKFTKVATAEAEIRVIIDAARGYSSQVGTAALGIASSNATMNLQINGDQQDDRRRHTLHEFGHALGAVHEHKSPDAKINWDVPKVYEYFERTQGWNQATIDRNVLSPFTADQTRNTPFDKDSIMVYSYPASVTLDHIGLTSKKVLSATDKYFIGLMYPWFRRSENKGSFMTSEVNPPGSFVKVNALGQSFTPGYTTVPKVAIALSYIACASPLGTAVKAFTENVTTSGMKVHVDSWGSSMLAGGGATWFEFAEDEKSFQTGTCYSSVLQSPTLEYITDVSFTTTFLNTPKVVTFINYLDCDASHKTRLQVSATDVTTTGFKAHISTTDGAVINKGGMTWIAYDPNNLPDGIAASSDTNVDTSGQPRSTRNGHLAWNAGTVFTKPPTVMLALNTIDLPLNALHGTYIACTTADVTTSGFDWTATTAAGIESQAVGVSHMALGTKIAIPM